MAVFAHPAVLEFLDAQPKLEYVVGDGQEFRVEAGCLKAEMRRARQLSRCSGRPNIFMGSSLQGWEVGHAYVA